MRYDFVEPSLKLAVDKCVGCGLCWTVCPHRVFRMKDGKAGIAVKERCMECGACQSNCPVGAIEVDSGVGCAVAVVNGIRKGSEPSC